METISYSSARGNFRKTMDKVCDDRAPVVITRQNARPVVMMSLEDYNSINETLYLLRSPKNAQRLLKAAAETKRGKFRKRPLSKA